MRLRCNNVDKNCHSEDWKQVAANWQCQGCGVLTKGSPKFRLGTKVMLKREYAARTKMYAGPYTLQNYDSTSITWSPYHQDFAYSFEWMNNDGDRCAWSTEENLEAVVIWRGDWMRVSDVVADRIRLALRYLPDQLREELGELTGQACAVQVERLLPQVASPQSASSSN